MAHMQLQLEKQKITKSPLADIVSAKAALGQNPCSKMFA